MRALERMAAVAGASIPCHSGWVGGKTARPCSGLPHTGAPSASASATSGVDRAGLGDLVAGDDRQLAGRGADEQRRQPVDVGRHRAGGRRGTRGGTGACDLAVEVVHADGHEHRPARRGQRVAEGPAQDGAELVGRAHLVGPLADRAGQAHEVARQQRVVDQVALVLLPGGHDQRRAVGPGVGEAADRVAEPGRGVQVHERRTARGLRVPVGHADHGRLLEREHVVEVVGRRRARRSAGSSVLPGLPKMWVTPSVRRISSRTSRPSTPPKVSGPGIGRCGSGGGRGWLRSG